MSLHSDSSVQTKEKRTRIKAKLRLIAGGEVSLEVKKENSIESSCGSDLKKEVVQRRGHQYQVNKYLFL